MFAWPCHTSLIARSGRDFLLQIADMFLQPLHGKTVALPDEIRQALNQFPANG